MLARRMFFSISLAWPWSSSTMTILTAVLMGCLRLRQVQAFGKFQGESRAFSKLRLHVDRAAEAPYAVSDEGEAKAFAGLVLLAGAAKQLEDPLVVPRGNAPAVVRDPVDDPGVIDLL